MTFEEFVALRLGALLRYATVVTARYLYSTVPEAGNYLVVELGRGLVLTVYSMDLDQAAIIALAAATDPPDPEAMTWLGQ